jgi:anti-sigma B factor antagonist
VEILEGSVGEVTVLQVRGRVDSTTAPRLRERLEGALGRPGGVVLDLRDVDYVSSAGFRVLLLAAKRADGQGTRLVLSGVAGKVHQLFDLGGFLDLFLIVGSRDDAVAAARRPSPA